MLHRCFGWFAFHSGEQCAFDFLPLRRKSECFSIFLQVIHRFDALYGLVFQHVKLLRFNAGIFGDK